MAISYEQMPEEYQRAAIQIFADQQNGLISNAEAEQRARANEAAAEQAVAAGATGGSFLLGQPSTTQPPATETPVPTNPFEDPRQKPFDAPEGFDYVWNGTEWELTEVAMRGPTRAQRESAEIIINNLLEDYGLGGLGKFVYSMVFEEDVMTGEEILARIRADRGEAGNVYRTRFAGNEARRQASSLFRSRSDSLRPTTWAFMVLLSDLPRPAISPFPRRCR